MYQPVHHNLRKKKYEGGEGGEGVGLIIMSDHALWRQVMGK